MSVTEQSGQPGQLPQLYAGFGIDSVLFYRGVDRKNWTQEFIWEGPDGTQALAHLIAQVDQAKPVVALADGVMASAAYWYGSAARARLRWSSSSSCL